MPHIAKELLMDCSTRDEFHFSLCCAECGESWSSRPIRFSKSGIVPETKGKRVVFDALYQREREMALNRVASEATGILNKCPICRRWVCDHCFMICDDLDMCVQCAAELNENGMPVLPKVIELAADTVG